MGNEKLEKYITQKAVHVLVCLCVCLNKTEKNRNIKKIICLHFVNSEVSWKYPFKRLL